MTRFGNETIFTYGDYRLVRNGIAGYIQAEPKPTEEFLDQFYAEEYFQDSKVDYVSQQESDREWWDLVYRRRLQSLDNELHGSGRRILDVGCGPGFFLQTAQDQGWESVGIDPAPYAVDFAISIGVDARVGRLDEDFVESIDQPFDVVHLHGVLEHVRDPIKVLDLIRRILCANGLLYLSVANDFNPIQMVLWKECGFDPWWICPPEHLNYFSKESLNELAIYTGYSIVTQTSTFPIDLFLLMGENYVSDQTLGKRLHRLRTTMEVTLSKARETNLTDAINGAFNSILCS